VADDRESVLQRSALATEIARVAPGFDQVIYPDWEALLARAWTEMPRRTVLALDEFPALVAVAPEVPSLLQKYIDRPSGGPHLVLAGSSQRMMQGLVLDRTAPLYGRATEILKISPLACGWIRKALRLRDDRAAVEAFALWGGVPRYWELALDFPDQDAALQALILSPLGVLHDEPARLLLDDLRDVTQAASILTLIGQGCHRLSEIAGRLGKPATSLSRPMERLLELGLVCRVVPFGVSPRDTKRSLYRIADPYLRFWFRFVEPNRSRLEARQAPGVAREIQAHFSQHVSGVWEDLVRESIPRRQYFGRTWREGRPWWGAGRDRAPLELDVVAESVDGAALLLGEVKWTTARNTAGLATTLQRKAERFPLAEGRQVLLGVWVPASPGRRAGAAACFGPSDVLRALR
jgi:AAA+ ATPase superfamily predicted ATPase